MKCSCPIPLFKIHQADSINECFVACSASDDNLLKNLELFDKLSLRFSGRVLFLKDVIGSQEICLWSFFGHGKKVAEVCCTSIVYATDKKHTKVNLPLTILRQTIEAAEANCARTYPHQSKHTP